MEAIFELVKFVKANPREVTYFFTIINAIWVVYIFISKKNHKEKLEKMRFSHEIALEQEKQKLNWSLERRKKNFEMKANQYEQYFNNMDAYHERQNRNISKFFYPAVTEFSRQILNATDEQSSINAVQWFSEQINIMCAKDLQDHLVLEKQTNSLKLTASDDVSQILEELKILHNESFELSAALMREMPNVIKNKDENNVKKIQDSIQVIGSEIKVKSENLREKMRLELQE